MQVPDEPLDAIGELLTPKRSNSRRPVVPEFIEHKRKPVVLDLQQLAMAPPNTSKQMVPEQPLPHILPMPRPVPLPDPVPRVPDQPVCFQRLVIPRPFNIRLFGSLPGYDDDIGDIKQQEVMVRPPDKTVYRKSSKLFEIHDEMIFRKHLPRQLHQYLLRN